jgi:hypothetical protein
VVRHDGAAPNALAIVAPGTGTPPQSGLGEAWFSPWVWRLILCMAIAELAALGWAVFS